MKNKIKIPSDIKRYIALRVGARILSCVLLLAAVIFALWYYKDTFTEYSISAVILAHIVPIALVFILSGVPKKFINDKSWIGTIEDIHVKTVIRAGVKNGRSRAYFENIVVLTVKTEDGETIVHEAKGFNSDSEHVEMEFFLDNYKIGDKIAHIYKTKYLQTVERIDEEDEKDNVFCVICGEDNPKENEKCGKCGHSLKITEA